MLGQTHTEQTRVGEKDVSSQAAIVAVQEVAGDGGRVKNILYISHELPATGIRYDQSEVEIGVTMDAVVWIIVEHTCPGVRLPIEIAVQRGSPIGRYRKRVIGRQ